VTDGHVLIIGATSPIARYTAEALGKMGYRPVLAARDAEELERLGSDLRIRTGLDVKTVVFDADDVEGIPGWIEEAWEALGPWAGMVWAVGDMGEQTEMESDPLRANAVWNRNLVAPAAAMTAFGMRLAQQEDGFIIGIGSVAGDRGRRKNYSYGAAKAGFHAFMQGLRSRLYDSHVRVITIKPGFVDTSMTFGMKGLFLLGNPRKIGFQIARTLDGKKDVVYLPGPWRWIMFIVRAIPEGIFKKLSF